MYLLSIALLLAPPGDDSGPESVPFPSLMGQEDEEPAEEDVPVIETKTPWEGSVTLGGSFTSGNNDNQSAAATADAVRRVYRDRYTLTFNWSWQEEGGTTNQRQTAGGGQYDRFLSEHSYLLANVGAMSDLNAGVDLRWTTGVGYGYQFRDDAKLSLAGEAGVSYLSETFDVGPDNEYPALRLAYRVGWTPNPVWELSQDASFLPSLEDGDDFFARVDTRLRASLTQRLFGQLQWIFNYDSTPAPGSGEDDSLFLLTLGWKF